MDSMRSLNTSLPRPPRKGRSSQPPDQLLQAFKVAALSVTTLYKTAAADQTAARQAGYQDALDEFLAFLDKENLGLGDGEGWKVRQWATERLDGSRPAQVGSDDDEDRIDASKRVRSISPCQRVANIEEEHKRQTSISPTRTTPYPRGSSTSTTAQASVSHLPEAFTFRSMQQPPQDTDMPAQETISNSTTPSELSLPLHTPTSGTPASVRVEVVPRATRTPHRKTVHSNHYNTKSFTTSRALGSGAGSKRRVPIGDYFDISSLGDRWDARDATGSSMKRGRPS